MLDKMYNQSHSQDLDILLCKTYLYDDMTGDIDDKATYFNLKVFDNFDKDVFNHSDTVDFINRISVTAWAKLFKRDFISENNIKFPPGLVFEDNPFFFETYLNANRIGLSKEFFYFYRVNREDSIIKSNKDFSDKVLVFRLIREILYKRGLLNVYKEIIYTKYLNNFYWRCELTSDEYKDRFLSLMKDEFNQIIVEDTVDENDFRINIYDLPKPLQNKINNTLKSDSYLEFKCLDLLDENNSLKENNEKLNINNKKLKKQVEKEKKKNKTLLNSNSWKITKPLRRIKNLFK